MDILTSELSYLLKELGDIKSLLLLNNVVGNEQEHNRLLGHMARVQTRIEYVKIQMQQKGEQHMSLNPYQHSDSLADDSYRSPRLAPRRPMSPDYADPWTQKKNAAPTNAQKYLVASDKENSTVTISLHPLALQLVFNRMQTEEGRAELMAILEKSLDANCDLASKFELEQVRGHGASVEFELVAKGQMLVVPDIIEDYKVRESFQLSSDELAAIRGRAARDAGDYIPHPSQVKLWNEPRKLVAFNGTRTAMPAHPFSEKTVEEAMHDLAKDVLSNVAAEETAYGPMPHVFTEEEVNRVLGRFGKDDMIKAAEMNYGGWTNPSIDAPTEPLPDQRTKDTAMTFLTGPRTATSNGEAIIYRTDLDTFHMFKADGDDHPAEKIDTFTDEEQLRAFFKRIEDEAFELELKTGYKAQTLKHIDEKVWYAIEY